jgi:RNA polymerase sigma-70 factor, ECF subfamily
MKRDRTERPPLRRRRPWLEILPPEPREAGHRAERMPGAEQRAELAAFARRMLGSAFEAEDAVQETMLRAWRSFDGFEERSSFRSWLYRITTNVCLDMLQARERRAKPMDLGPAKMAHVSGSARHEPSWVPLHMDRDVLHHADPADIAQSRETIRLAFAAAVQHLPPRQRAVLILRDVLRWRAAEVAELLGSSVAAVNSALQRARMNLEAVDVEATGTSMDSERQMMLERYVDAFQRHDVDGLIVLLRRDARPDAA